jgi:DNA-binding transcriptional MocR family regulator
MAEMFFPSVQLAIKPGTIDLTWGQPDPTLLPVEEMRAAADAAMSKYGADALGYGADAGAGPLMHWLAERMGQNEGRMPAADEILITAGISDALDQICTHLTRPGDTVIVEAPTYHLAVRILQDHDLDIVAAPTDAEGLRVDALEGLVSELDSAGKKPKFLYSIPTFHNPTGASLSAARRRALLELAAARNFLIVEDDVYRELGYDAPSPPSLWSSAEDGMLLRMGSFSKSLAPGLRLGWLTGARDTVQKLVRSGLRDSGGGVNHFTAMVVAAFCEAGYFAAQVTSFRAAYRERRDALAAALRAHVPQAEWRVPGGGFFIWGSFPDGRDTTKLKEAAEGRDVTFIPGSRFYVNGKGRSELRLAFSLYSPDELREAARRLGEGAG